MRDYIVATLCTLAQSVMSFAVAIASARLLGPTGRGEYYLIVQLAALLSVIFTFGLGSSYQYYLLTRALEPRTALGHALRHLLVVCCSAAIVGTIGRPILGALVGEELTGSTAWTVCTIAIVNVVQVISTSLHVGMFKSVTFNNLVAVVASFTYASLIVVFVGVIDMGVWGAIAALLASLVVKTLPALLGVTLRQRTASRSSPRTARLAIYSYAIGSFIFNLAVVGLFRSSAFIVNGVRGPRELGIYSVALTYAEMGLLIPAAVGTTLFAQLPELESTQRGVQAARAARLLSLVGSLIALFLILLSWPLVVWPMGSEFRGAIIPLCILAGGVSLLSGGYSLANYFAAAGRPLVPAAAFSCGIACMPLAHDYLMQSFGINGAAAATTFCYGVVSAALVLVYLREPDTSIRDLLLRRSDLLELWKCIASKISVKSKL